MKKSKFEYRIMKTTAVSVKTGQRLDSKEGYYIQSRSTKWRWRLFRHFMYDDGWFTFAGEYGDNNNFKYHSLCEPWEFEHTKVFRTLEDARAQVELSKKIDANGGKKVYNTQVVVYSDSPAVKPEENLQDGEVSMVE